MTSSNVLKVTAGLFSVACIGILSQKSFENTSGLRTQEPGNDRSLEQGEDRSLWSLFGSSSSSSEAEYDGKGEEGEYCYNVNIGGGQLCCDGSYHMEKGFRKNSVCYLGKTDYSCKDLHEAVFVADGAITMASDMIGKRAFPSIISGDGFEIHGNPMTGDNGELPFDYTLTTGKQNGLKTKLTGDAIPLPEKSFLVSAWDEKNEPSDHEIEWAGPNTVGLGGESFAAPAVIMKGGGAGLVYLDDLDGVLHGTGFKTPIDPAEGTNYDTKAVEFCFAYQPAAPGGESMFRDGDEEEEEEETEEEGGEDDPAEEEVEEPEEENPEVEETDEPEGKKVATDATEEEEDPEEDPTEEEEILDALDDTEDEKPTEEEEILEALDDPAPPKETPTQEATTKDDLKRTTDAGIKGDPHIKRWDGVTYDFHGACDLVMLHNPDFNNGQGMQINIRTKLQHWWSFIETAVIKIGDDTLEVRGGAQERRYWVNGKEGNRFRASRNLPFTIGGFHGRFRAINKVLTQYKLFLPNDQVLTIKSTKNMLRVDLEESKEEDFGNSLGLMGAFGSGVMFGRDNQTVIEDPNQFGLEWQVRDDEPMLFHEIEGAQFPERCTMPSTHEIEAGVQRRMLAASLSLEDAEKVCSGVTLEDERANCVSDVLATGDVDMAGAYI